MIAIRPADPARPDFVGDASGIDLRQPITPDQVRQIDAGMAQYAVLVFRDQPIDDDQQLAFTRHFGSLETATPPPWFVTIP